MNIQIFNKGTDYNENWNVYCGMQAITQAYCDINVFGLCDLSVDIFHWAKGTTYTLLGASIGTGPVPCC